MKLKDEIRQAITASATRGHPRFLVIACALILLGAVAFFIGISGQQAQRAWQAYLINFVFWSGLSYGAVLFVAVLNITKARWGRPLKRLAEAPAAFLPVAFVLFWVLYFGREAIFPWIHESVEGKEGWLNVEFMFARVGAGLLLMTAVALAMVYVSVRADQRVAANLKQVQEGSLTPDENVGPAIDRATERGWRLQIILSPIMGILYALVMSLVAIDLVMSLDPHWYSTLFGAYYFVGSFYTALAALIILAALSRRAFELDPFIRANHFHDLGKLLLGFCLLTGDFFYSQFLVIWYGNLSEETKYVILRVRQAPWEPLAWGVLIVCFAVPFVVLLSRKIKMRPGPLMVLSGMILVGMWLERLLLVAPSLWKGAGLPIGVPEVMITAGFFGAVALCVMIFLRRYPLLPVSDPLFQESLESQGNEVEASHLGVVNG